MRCATYADRKPLTPPRQVYLAAYLPSRRVPLFIAMDRPDNDYRGELTGLNPGNRFAALNAGVFALGAQIR